MAPPRKRARTSPANTAASSPPASTPSASKLVSVPDSTSPVASDAWTPAQETALLKLLIHHKPAGLHKHFNMLSIYNSLQSQGLTHTNPIRGVPAVAIEHMLPQRIWDKLHSLYDLDTLDEREEHYRLSNEPRESSEEPNERSEWQFTHEFVLDAPKVNAINAQQADDLSEKMFARRLKPDSEASSSPPLEERLTAGTSQTPPAKGNRAKGSARGTRTSLRQGGPAGGRRGSRTTTATTSTAGDEEEERQEEDGEEAEVAKPSRATRGSVRTASKKGKGSKKKG